MNPLINLGFGLLPYIQQMGSLKDKAKGAVGGYVKTPTPPDQQGGKQRAANAMGGLFGLLRNPEMQQMLSGLLANRQTQRQAGIDAQMAAMPGIQQWQAPQSLFQLPPVPQNFGFGLFGG